MAQTRRTPKGRARARGRTGRHHERPSVVRARAKDRSEHQQAGGSSARIHFVCPSAGVTARGARTQFFIVLGGVTVVTSKYYETTEEAKQGLIDLVMAIQADDFETFDHT